MKSEVEIYDTTLRDGSQGEGINFSVADKLRIAERIDAFGIHYIEGGWPGSNPKDIEFFAQAKRRKLRRARLAAFGATRRKGVAVENDDQVRLLLEAETPVVTLVGKTWLLHVKEVLRTTAEENLAMIGDTIRYLKDHGKFVIYDAEHSFDGFSDGPDYALASWQAAERAGADFVVLCDTNGGRLPKLKELSQCVDGIANVRHNPRLPWVGSAAFSHKGGQHVNAVQKVARSYEHINPSLVGNTRTVLISDLAGKSNIVLKAQELGFKITNDTPELKTILARIKELEHQGHEFEAAEGSLALLIRKLLKHRQAPFTVVAYHVSMRRDGLESIVEATVTVRAGGQVAPTVAQGAARATPADSA